jgi:hypothetical protein
MEAYNESICVSISMDFIGGCMGALRIIKTDNSDVQWKSETVCSVRAKKIHGELFI